MKTETYIIEGMSCAACSSAVERVTRKIEGVQSSDVNLIMGKMTITYDPTLVTPERIMAAVDRAGFGIRPDIPEPKAAAPAPEQDIRLVSIIAAAVFGALLMYVSMGHMIGSGLPLPALLDPALHPLNFALAQCILCLPVLFIGRKYFLSGIKALVSLHPNMDSLVAVGCTASFVYSIVMTALIPRNSAHIHDLYYESAAVVLTLIMLGKYLEKNSKRKTQSAISKLMELAPDTAVLLAPDGSQSVVKSDTLRIGDIVVVKPGARIPLDGQVTEGESGVDESMLTGESLPVLKTSGDTVTGGSINQNGVLYVRITHTGEDTTLSKIIRFVQDAQGKKAPIAKTADKVAGVFVPIVMSIAVLSAAAWLIAGYELSFALRIFTSVLVIACPCALGLATPTAIMVGTGLGAQNGILIRSGEALEITHKTQTVVFDKTGTLTEGKPSLTDIVCYNIDRNALLSAAASAESVSDHPLAHAVVEYAAQQGIAVSGRPDKFENISGMGIIASLPSGEQIVAGSLRFMVNRGIATDIADRDAAALSQKGCSIIAVAVDGTLRGIIGIADKIKPTAAEAVARLRAMGLHTVILTGDNRLAAEYIAAAAGVDEVCAEVLPEQKAAMVAKLQQRGIVMMVGDGINDAPALAQADIGCAVGGGSDIAIESADVVLMKSDIRDVPRAIRLSRLTVQDIRQNLFWAFCYNTIGIPVAAGVLYPAFGLLLSPMIGAFAMSLSSICVVTNALRLKTKKL